MSLDDQRQSLRRLLDERQPADALESYYAYHHAPGKTHLAVYPPGGEAGTATGYLAISRTGYDLFRPLVTLRLPVDWDREEGLAASADLIYGTLAPETAVILLVPDRYGPLLQAFFAVQTEETLRLLRLDRNLFEPVINVMVVQSEGPNGLPRFVIRSRESGQEEVVAAAGINWQSPHFAEINVHTDARYQRQGWGKSVLAAAVQYVVANGRMPLYLVAERNHSSAALAQSVGFVGTGLRYLLLSATLKPRP